MKVQPYERVIYERNPLAEVICQIQYKPLASAVEGAEDGLRKLFLEQGYTKFSKHITSIQISSGDEPAPDPAPPIVQRANFFHSEDDVWRVTVATDFIALTCMRYSTWQDFLPRVETAVSILLSQCANESIQPTRIGLRYKDLIEREALGLDRIPWQELIMPFLLGPLAPGALMDGQEAEEADVSHFQVQSLLQIEGAKALLSGSLLDSVDGGRRAFLIDSDFFEDQDLDTNLLLDSNNLMRHLEKLHSHAGALFRRCITGRLHDALSKAAN